VLGAERLCVTVNLAGEWRRPAPHTAPVEPLYRHGPSGAERHSLLCARRWRRLYMLRQPTQNTWLLT